MWGPRNPSALLLRMFCDTDYGTLPLPVQIVARKSCRSEAARAEATALHHDDSAAAPQRRGATQSQTLYLTCAPVFYIQINQLTVIGFSFSSLVFLSIHLLNPSE